MIAGGMPAHRVFSRETPRRIAGPDGMQRSADRDDGQILVMVIGYVLLALLLATVVMAVSAVYIEYKKLLSVADGAAVAAADSYTLGDVVGEGKGPAAVLNSERVRAVTRSFLERNGAYARFDQLAIAPGTRSPDNASAEVALTAVVHPPLVNFLLPAGITVEAESTARSRITR